MGRDVRLAGGHQLSRVARSVAAPNEPVGQAQRQCGTRQRKQLGRADGLQIEQDEFPGQRQECNQQYHRRLDDTLLARNHVLQRVVEFERNQQRHDFAEDRLENRMVQRVERVETRGRS